jgi:ABC-type sulfate transport system substrate-binding protein
MTTWEFCKYWDPEEYEEVKVLYLFNTPPGWLHSISKIDELADVQGMDIMAVEVSPAGIVAIGASLVGGSQADVVTLAKAGDIVVNIAPAEVLVAFSQHKVLTILSLFHSSIPMAFSWQ